MGLYFLYLTNSLVLSKNFCRIYPGAYRHIVSNKQSGCPTCVSLGTNGNGFIRTQAGVWHNLRRSTTTKLGDMGEIESLWLGFDGAYIAVRKDRSTTWDLKGKYIDLPVCLQLVCHAPGMDGSAIKVRFSLSCQNPSFRSSRYAGASHEHTR